MVFAVTKNYIDAEADAYRIAIILAAEVHWHAHSRRSPATARRPRARICRAFPFAQPNLNKAILLERYRVFLLIRPQRNAMNNTEFGQARIPVIHRSATAYVVEFAIVGTVFFGLVKAGLLLPSPIASPLWPPTGCALAAILLRGYRIWPAILAGSLSSYLLFGGAILQSSSIVGGTLLAALAGAFLISRWSAPETLFATPQSVAKFSFICFVPTAVISSIFALGSSELANGADPSDAAVTWIFWWLADATATLIVLHVSCSGR